MCGLFGTIRPTDYPTHQRLISPGALDDLGYLAEERGEDSAGLAIRTSTTAAAGPAIRGRGIRDRRHCSWRVVTTLGAFSQLPVPKLVDDIVAADTVIGHTRAATQGAVVLANASPMRVGRLIGAHNGDIDADVRGRTDSHVLLAALGAAEHGAAAANVLAGVNGRVALVWASTAVPGRLNLARGAWSPLAISRDPAGALWWASNPEWLRVVSDVHGLDLTEPTLLEEGTVLAAVCAPTRVDIVDRSVFTASGRPFDESIGPWVAWRGFTDEDAATDWEQQTHSIQALSDRVTPRDCRIDVVPSVVTGVQVETQGGR